VKEVGLHPNGTKLAASGTGIGVVSSVAVVKRCAKKGSVVVKAVASRPSHYCETIQFWICKTITRFLLFCF
jgi:hypothetical protein